MPFPPAIASIPQPPFGSSPMMRPSGNPGAAANAVTMVNEAIGLLEKALADIPAGHPLHKALLQAIGNLSKHAPAADAAPGVGLTALKQLLAERMRQSPLAALMQPGAGAAPPGAAPGGPPPPGGPPGGAPPIA